MMPKVTKFARAVDCPTCGATQSNQRWKPRKMVDFDDYTPIGNCDPVDAVHCRKSDLVFRVAHFEHDDTYITNWDEIETIPRYCPWCGEKLTSDGA